jgi:uncharacterized protein
MHFFLFPTSTCNSSCKYCFSKADGERIINIAIFRKEIYLLKKLAGDCNDNNINITFHGGEPLLAGIDFYKKALPLIQKVFGNTIKIGIQSNLWNINDEYCELFKQFRIQLGTSLDGPEEVNNFQRTIGYFKRTMSGIELLRKYGLSPGCIATITSYSAPEYKDILNFFLTNEIPFDIHPAIKPINFSGDDQIFITSTEYANFITNILEYYIHSIDKIKINTLDTLIKNVSNDKSGLCTFTKCLGNYLAVDPVGDLYTCNRFVGNKEFSLGNIKNVKSWADIKKSPAWQKLENWQKVIDFECARCLHKNVCHGGCPYVAFAAGNGKPIKDPYCEAYKTIYKYIIDKGAEEFFSDNNLLILQSQSSKNNNIHFNQTPILYLMKDNPHPFNVKQTSKKIITAALLGKTASPKQTTEKLFELGIVSSIEEKFPMIEQFYHELSEPSQGLNNLYLHITTNCNLTCSHCYSYNGDEIKNTHLSPEVIMRIITDTTSLTFRKIIFTGGEPLLFHDFEQLLDELKNLRSKKKLPTLVLRTNLSSNLNSTLIDKINSVFDQIIISIDGSEEIHDKQRGKGAYQRTMNNLALFDAKTIEKKLSFACVLNQQNLSDLDVENEKHSVNALKTQYPVKEIRFLPLLPLGRAKYIKTQRNEAEMLSVTEWMNRKYFFRTSCGLGQSVMIESNGDVYPCHVLKEAEKQTIGNVYESSLQEITQKREFCQLRNINVNTNPKCRQCEMRYLCGGVCKIWENQDCLDLYNRAKYLLKDAMKICNIPDEKINS